MWLRLSKKQEIKKKEERKWSVVKREGRRGTETDNLFFWPGKTKKELL